MTIYTRKGDKGETGLPGKRRLSKTDLMFDCLGGLDQTNALIGLAVSLIDADKESELIGSLQHIQRDLLSIGSTIAAEAQSQSPVLALLADRALEMEKQIDAWDQLLPELKNFILPGGNQAAAVIHLARVSTRETERAFHRLNSPPDLDPIAVYINRLSDYFFQCARYLNYRADQPDIVWKTDGNIS